MLSIKQVITGLSMLPWALAKEPSFEPQYKQAVNVCNAQRESVISHKGSKDF